jgi:hypothetical protein
MAKRKIIRGLLDELRTPEEQLPLLDPRFDKRTKEQDRLRNLVATVEERGTQNAPGIPLADLEGQPFVTSMSDRTRAGGLLTRINQIPLRDPVNLQGGQGFMFENPGAVWANAPGGVRQHQEAAQALKQRTGQDPLFIPWRMAPTGQDFATMSGEAMIGYAATNLSKNAKRKFDASMKNIIPDWPGIDSPESVTAFRSSRKTVREKAQAMMDRDFRNSGGLGLGEARLAVADPAQRVARDGGIQNIGRINLDAPMIKNVGHPSYAAGLPGEGLGRTSQDVGVFELLPDEVRARGLSDPLNPPYNHLRSLQMKPYGGVITEEVLRNLQARGVDVTKPAVMLGALGLGAAGTEEAQAGPVNSARKMVADLPGRNELNWWPISGDEAIEGGWNKTGDELVILDKIFLDLQNRGRGEGRKIVNQLIKDAAAEYPGRKMGLLAEPLDEYTDADQLVKFYESLGFDVGDYVDGMSGIPMTMRLPANIGKANLLGRATPGAMAATAATGAALTGLLGASNPSEGAPRPAPGTPRGLQFGGLGDTMRAANRASGVVLDALEMPGRGLLGLGGLLGALGTRQGAAEAVRLGAERARAPIEDTAYEIGGNVTDTTGSPAMGTAAYLTAQSLNPLDMLLFGGGVGAGRRALRSGAMRRPENAQRSQDQ